MDSTVINKEMSSIFY